MLVVNQKELDQFIGKNGFPIEVGVVKKTRTSTQNRALHLFFKLLSDELNSIGMTYVDSIAGMDIEQPFTEAIVKNQIWAKIQIAMFGTDSTTKLKRGEIDQILTVLANHYAELGVPIQFPDRFSLYEEMYGTKK